MIEKNKKAVEYVINKIKSLDGSIKIRFDQNAAENEFIYRFDLTFHDQTIRIEYSKSLMDDFEVAIERYTNTHDYYKLENFIKYKIYIALGLEGLIQDFEVSSEIINDKGPLKEKDLGYNLSFDDLMYGVLNRGLKKLSDFLADVIAGHDLELKDMQEEKRIIDGMIAYSKKYGHLASDGVEVKSRGFLKAAAVCEIIDKENERSRSGLNRIRKEITKDIYKIVMLLRNRPYRNVKMPECIKDYYEAKKTLRSSSYKHYNIKPTYKTDTSIEGSPKAFISYSWDDEKHKEWVKDLAIRLRSDGVTTILDQWHTALGDQMPEFMEKSIRENDFVLIICTPNYKRKSDSRKGGVGYEGDIMTAEVYSKIANRRKFIPILRGNDWNTSAPSWLVGSKRIDLHGDPYDEKQYIDLCDNLLNRREQPPPVKQTKPNRRTNETFLIQNEMTKKLSFHIPNPKLWTVSNDKYTALGKEDTFAWSEEIIEGDVIINVDIESKKKDGEGVIIVYGEGVKWSRGCLIFNITPDVQSIRAHTPYEGVAFLSETKNDMNFLDHTFSVSIEIIGDKATMYVDGEIIVSTFLTSDIKRKGRIGLFKYHERPKVTYSNITIRNG